MVGAMTTDGDGWASPGDLARAVESKENRTASSSSTRQKP